MYETSRHFMNIKYTFLFSEYIPDINDTCEQRKTLIKDEQFITKPIFLEDIF